MTAAESRTQLRAAVFTRNVHGLLRLLEGNGWPSDALQLIGDGLIDALRSGVGEAADSARRCVAELRARGWDGDHALAEALEVALGTAPVHRLRPVPVDLEDVATALDGGFSDETEIDLITGDLRFGPDADIDDEDDEQEREWLPIEARGLHGRLPRPAGIHRATRRRRGRRPAECGDRRTGGVPQIQGHHRPMAGFVGDLVRVQRGAAARAGPGLAGRRGTHPGPRAQGGFSRPVATARRRSRPRCR